MTNTVKLYSFIKTIRGLRYDFNIPCATDVEATIIAQLNNWQQNGRLIESHDVCVNCLSNTGVRNTVPLMDIQRAAIL